MNNRFNYHGQVTLVSRVNNKIVAQKYYNSGSDILFEAYARALSGQPVNQFIPSTIDIGTKDGDTFNSCLRDELDIIVNYKNSGSEGTNYGKPYTRVSVIITKNAFDSSKLGEGTPLYLRLKSPINKTQANSYLAEVNIPGLADIVNSITPGVQLILLWDLYVANHE